MARRKEKNMENTTPSDETLGIRKLEGQATLPPVSLLDCCPDWPVQIEKVNGPIVLQSLRAGRDLYDGIPFRYCPWCGKKRPEQEKQSNSDLTRDGGNPK